MKLPRVLYLHGFASGPLSRKAQFFRRKLTSQGIRLEIPALDQDDFEHLTLSSQLDLITRLLNGSAVTIIGSSMGGYLAALYASIHPEVDRMVLLAPAFGFGTRWVETFGAQRVAEWRTRGFADIYHYATNPSAPFPPTSSTTQPYTPNTPPALSLHSSSTAVTTPSFQSKPRSAGRQPTPMPNCSLSIPITNSSTPWKTSGPAPSRS